jgi:hypothetical protein
MRFSSRPGNHASQLKPRSLQRLPVTQPGIDDFPPCTDSANGAYLITGDYGGESGQYRERVG